MKNILTKSAMMVTALFMFAAPALPDQFNLIGFGTGTSAEATITGGLLTNLTLGITTIKDYTTGYSAGYSDTLETTSCSGSTCSFELIGTLLTAAGSGVTTSADLFNFNAAITVSGSVGAYTVSLGAPTSLTYYNPGIGGTPANPNILSFVGSSDPSFLTTGTGASNSVTSASNFDLNFTRSTPEPASFVLFGTGLLAIGIIPGVRRRRLAKSLI
jgi:hypothetical protein